MWRRLSARAGVFAPLCTTAVFSHEWGARAQPESECESTTASHVSSLHRDGFVVIRGAVPPEMCARARAAALQELDVCKGTPSYHFWKQIVYPVNNPKHRYELLLMPTPPLEELVRAVVSEFRSLYTSLITPDGALVEFGAIISEPGARQQDVHSDIPFSDQTLLYTTFIALQDIDPSLGPTCVFPATHTEEFHARARRVSMEWAAGAGEEVSLSLPRFFDLLIPDWLSTTTLRPPFDEIPAEQMTLRAGDILIYDTRLYHFGGANCATVGDDDAKRRVLLQFSFLAPNPQTGRVDFEGSYVSLAPDLEKEQRTLRSFLPPCQ